MEGILSIKNLSKSFERSGMKTDALKNASFELKCGEILGIVGTSGSGKSTLLRLISGLEAPNAGLIRLDGHELGTKRSIAEKTRYTDDLPGRRCIISSSKDNSELDKRCISKSYGQGCGFGS